MEIKVNDNITMRTLSVSDAKETFSVIDKNRTYLRQWLPWVDATTSDKVTENVILAWESEYQNGAEIVLGIFCDNRHVGNIGLHSLKKANNSGMIGYWLAAKEQGKGIMTKCVAALIKHGFETLKLNRIYIHCADPNKRSQAVAERLGFIKEGVLRDGECLYGQYYDMVIYGLLKRDWDNAIEHM